MQSAATTVAAYLSELPADRRAMIEAVRTVILANLPDGIVEGMQYGMISYHVPHSLYAAGYHCDPRQPLPYAALALQKQYGSLYFMGLYCCPEERTRFEQEWLAAGKKLDSGKSCFRFKRLDDVALEVIAKAMKRMTVAEYIATYESLRPAGKISTKSGTKSTTKVVAIKGGGKKAAKRSQSG